MAATLSSLRSQVRTRADMVNSEFVSDSELTQFVNDSYKELYDLLVMKFQDYYLSSTLATVDESEDSIILPDDFYKLRGVDMDVGGGNYVALKPFHFADRNRTNRAWAYRSRPQYRIYQSVLSLAPADLAPGNYRLWYVPRGTDLVDDADAIDVLNGWEEYIVVSAAIKCLIKEESDPSALMNQLGALKQRIEEAAAERDAGNPEQIVDVYRSDNLDGYEW